MSHEDQHIRKLFSEKLANHELPVDPAVWQGVSQSIGASGAAAGTAAATGLSVGAKLAIVAAVVGVVVAGSWALSREENAPPTKDEHVPEQQLPVSPQDSLKDQVVQLPEEVNNEAQPTASNESSNDPLPSNKVLVMPAETSSGREAPDTVVYMRVSPQQEKPTDTVSSYEISRGTVPPNVPTQDEVPEITAKFSVVKDAYDPLLVHLIAECPDAHAYYWELGNGTHSFDPSVDVEYEEFGSYTVQLVVTDRVGKTETHESQVQLVPPSELFVPNVFSPNGDQWNDYFDIEAESKNVEVVTLFIFDEQNREVFTAAPDRKKWDGTDLHGNQCPQGIYRFWFEALGSDGRVYKQQGTVVLKR